MRTRSHLKVWSLEEIQAFVAAYRRAALDEDGAPIVFRHFDPVEHQARRDRLAANIRERRKTKRWERALGID